MKRIFSAVLLLTIVSAHMASASLYWVSPSGAASWANARSVSPLSGSAAAGLSTANANIAAGDTVCLRAGRYSTAIAPERSGNTSVPMVYCGYTGEKALIMGTNTALNLNGRSWVTVDNVTVDSNKVFLDARLGHHLIVMNSTLINSSDLGGWPTGILMYNDSRYNRISGCTIGHVGYSTSLPDDIGGVMTLGSWSDSGDSTAFNLLEGNHFYHGGHHIISMASRYCIIRNNSFHNENWMACQNPGSGNLCGNRGIIIEDDSRDALWNVIEGNRFAFMGISPDNGPMSGMSIRNAHTIIRRNMFYHNSATGMNLYADGSGTYEARYERIYQNVFYKNGASAVDFRYSFGLLFDNVTGNNPPIPITGNSAINNIFYQNTGGDIYFYYTSASSQTVLGNYYASASYNSSPLAAIAGNMISSADPRFVDVSARALPADIELFDFRLQEGSPAIDGGRFLTQTASSGSGTSMRVVDASYFTDGFGIVGGDLIQFEGRADTAIITAVDYAGNTLTLDRALGWASGLGVSLRFYGKAPDIGAYEYAGGSSIRRDVPCIKTGTHSAAFDVYDMKGRKVATVNGRNIPPSGAFTEFRSGVYLFREKKRGPEPVARKTVNIN